jgi:hypothetical protein
LIILAKNKKTLSSEFSEAKNQTVKKMYLRGALGSAQFFIASEKQLSSIKMQQKNLADIRHKLSIIYKHIQSMLNDLRYQAKRHAISEKLSKEKIKILHLLP